MNGYRAGLYIRLSREDEGEGPSESVTNQRAMLLEFARQEGFPVFDLYIDDGYSGTTFQRPGFQRLLEDIEAGKVNLVITKDLSRLGRDYILTGHYLERYFPERGVRYISLLDGIDTITDSAANDITPFRAILNDLYARDISRKIKSVKREKQRRGQFIGGKPMYGYKMHPTEKNKIVVDEEAAPVVRRLFALALEGLSCRKIAQRLNAEGVPTPARYCGRENIGSGLWRSEQISQMLRNETYLGHMVQGRRVKVSYKSKKCRRQEPADWVVVPNTHTPLVEEGTFRAVQALLDSRRHTRSRSYDFLLKGILTCKECGKPLGVLNRPPASGEDRLLFVCRTYQRFPDRCSCHCLGERAANRAVEETLKALCAGLLTREWLEPIAREVLQERPPSQADDLPRRLEALERRMDRMYGDYLSGLLEPEDFHRLYDDARQQRSRLEARIRQSTPQSPEEMARALTTRFLEEAFSRREVLVLLLESAELSRHKELFLHFRFRPPEASFSPPALPLAQGESIPH